jgi:diguanylate cyclase (GGDEF)-like protein
MALAVNHNQTAVNARIVRARCRQKTLLIRIEPMPTKPAQDLKIAKLEQEQPGNRFLGPVSRQSKRLGATLQASKQIFGSSGLRLPVPVHDIRLKILSLVVFAALAPALVVGTASYSTAKKILTEKLSGQLSAAASAAEQEVSRFLSDRNSDTKVFANAHVVSQNMYTWARAMETENTQAKATSRESLRQYLTQVQHRFPLYRDLHIIDLEDRLVISTRPTLDPDLPEIGTAFLEAREDAPIERFGEEALAYIHHPIVDQDYEPLGTLVTVSSLEDLWTSVAAEAQKQDEALRVLSQDGWLLFDTGLDPAQPLEQVHSQGAELALSGLSGVAEYPNEDGVAVLGAYRFQHVYRLAYLVEVATDQAFADTLGLRNFALLVSFIAAGLVTAIAILVILGLTRPIDALIAGAKAAASGDLSQQISVSSKDQIGYLTEAFNRMTTSLRESREKLEKMTRTDELTGLPNRRELDRMFKAELGRAERSQDPLSVLMVDLDNFKNFNDQYGHLKGDSLLSEACHFLNLNLRPSDIATRYGGEEFVILLPDTTKRQAASLAERLRQEFADACQDADDSNPWVTISIGVSTWPEDGRSKEDLIRGADTALYSAKRAGRDRVRTAVFPVPLLEQPAVNPDQVS